jgi:hypothetical protein
VALWPAQKETFDTRLAEDLADFPESAEKSNGIAVGGRQPPRSWRSSQRRLRSPEPVVDRTTSPARNRVNGSKTRSA